MDYVLDNSNELFLALSGVITVLWLGRKMSLYIF